VADLTSAQKNIATARLDFVNEYLDDSARATDLIRRGRLLIVDVRDEFVEKGEALALFMVLLECFARAGVQGDERFNKIIVFDEAHKYMTETNLTSAITETVREMRHKGVSVVIASQDPPSIPREIVELSTVIFAHRFNAPSWLRHLQQSSQAFSSVGGGMLAGLATGSALLWSAGGAARYSSPQRVATRPRMTEHGGATLRVGELSTNGG
jgi:DNA helicase HerA-like ATPase